MARESHLDTGVTVYKPDSITVGHFKLLPELTPMENLWRLIRIQVSVWLCKYGVYSYDKERMEDLESSFAVEIYNKLRSKVRDGTYRRDLSLYLNVRGVAWSLASNILYRWIRDLNNDKEMLHVDWVVESVQRLRDTSVRNTLGDMISYEDVKRYLNTTEQQYAYKATIREIKRRQSLLEETDPVKKENRIKARDGLVRRVQIRNRDNTYHDYLGDCEIYGIEPITFEEFLRRNDLLDDPSPTGCSDSPSTCSQSGSSGKALEGKPRSAPRGNGRR